MYFLFVLYSLSLATIGNISLIPQQEERFHLQGLNILMRTGNVHLGPTQARTISFREACHANWQEAPQVIFSTNQKSNTYAQITWQITLIERFAVPDSDDITRRERTLGMQTFPNKEALAQHAATLITSQNLGCPLKYDGEIQQ